eukprot:GDKI01005142.1.p1 GENE.GDKI01005142.1~~GDKI01005142.1.p1  ORF type:complete len:590 (-),score=207.65 GDKI01005142.1:146-1915(-)
MTDISPLDFFKEELNAEGITAAGRLDVMHKVKYIAAALGPQKVVDELLPYLAELQKSADDEFLHALAEEYCTLADFVGGDNNLPLLSVPLEALASQEETVVRDRAVESLCGLCNKATDKGRPAFVQDKIYPILQRLATAEWFTSRVSACGLLPTTYKSANDQQKAEIRKMYTTLANDETPMVKRAAANKMRDLFKVCEKQYVLMELISTFKTMAADDTQDSIRVACFNAALELSRTLNADENKQHTLTVLTNAADDKSWRVRLAMSKQFNDLLKAFPAEMCSSYLLTPFTNLLKDTEQEVRTTAVNLIEKCMDDLSVDQLQTFIVPVFSILAQDPAQTVRAGLANIIGFVATKLGRELTQKLLLNLIMDLLKDENTDVRLNVVCHAGDICEILGADALAHSLLNAIQGLVQEAGAWRIRLSVVEQIPRLAKHFGQELFSSKLEGLFLNALTDPVHTVREATIKNIKVLAESFGPEWTVDHLLPKVLEQYSPEKSYSKRLTALHAVPHLASVLSMDQIERHLVPIVVKSMKDNVPNVRFASAKTASVLLDKNLMSPNIVQGMLKPGLQELINDSDGDVAHFASKALLKCK